MTSIEGDAHVAGDVVAGNKIVHTSTPAPEPPRELPLDTPGFTGRAAGLAKLDALVAGGKEAKATAPVVVVVTGMPGVGKTALAVHWARRIAPLFPDGQLFIELRGWRGAAAEHAALPAEEALGRALRALGVPVSHLPAEEREAAALYRSKLATRKMLIVLDDALSYRQVVPLLPASPSCLVVVTSRNKLPALVARHGARTLALDVLPPAEALDLVRVVAGKDRTEAEPAASAELVDLCARLPLALSVAAANLVIRPQQSVADTVQALAKGDRLSSLTLGGDLEEAVRAAFDLSYHSLGDELRRAFRMLGLLEAPTFTPDSTGPLLAITPAAARGLLNRLAAANLVQEVVHERYRTHELLREYARERSAAEDAPMAQQAGLQRMATWYLSEARRPGRSLDRYRRTIGQQLITPPDDVDPVERSRLLTWLVDERDNLLAVARQAEASGWDQLTWELADAMHDFLELRRHLPDNVETHRLGLRAAERADHHPAQFFMHHHLAMSLRDLGQYQEAFTESRRALELSRGLQDRYGEASALDSLARVHYAVGEYKQARTVASESLSIRREIGDRHGEALTLDTLARAYRGLSQYNEAWLHADRALAIHREIVDRRREAEVLDNLARILNAWGRHTRASEYAEQALAIWQDIDDRHGEGETLAFLGLLQAWLGSYPLARDYVDRALGIFRDITDRPGESRALEHLSVIQQRQGTYRDAIRSALEALDIVQELGDAHGECQVLNTLARAYRRIGLHQQAMDDAGRALALSRRIGDRFAEAGALDQLAHGYCRMGDLDRAAECAEEHLRLRREIEDRRGEGMALDNLATVHREMGQYESALALCRQALDIEMDVDDHFGHSATLHLIGRIYADLGRYPESIDHFELALALRRDIGSRRNEAATLYRLAAVLRELGRTGEAAQRAAEAREIEAAEQFDPPLATEFPDLPIPP